MSGFPKNVERELERARTFHPPINSLHEGYAVLLEEVEEFWDEVKVKAKNRNLVQVYDELVQIAATAQRIAEDVVLSGEGKI